MVVFPNDKNILTDFEIVNLSEDLFKDTLFSRENQKEYDFIWEIPDDNEYILIVFNPHNQTATYDIKYTDPYEGLTWICISLSCIGGVIIVIIIILLFWHLRKKNKQELNSYPPLQTQYPSKSRYQHSQEQRKCPKCKTDMRYSPHYSKWYCDICNKYR